jgi:hypothetical protein
MTTHKIVANIENRLGFAIQIPWFTSSMFTGTPNLGCTANSGSRAERYWLIEIDMMSHTFLFLLYRQRFTLRIVGGGSVMGLDKGLITATQLRFPPGALECRVPGPDCR